MLPVSRYDLRPRRDAGPGPAEPDGIRVIAGECVVGPDRHGALVGLGLLRVGKPYRDRVGRAGATTGP